MGGQRQDLPPPTRAELSWLPANGPPWAHSGTACRMKTDDIFHQPWLPKEQPKEMGKSAHLYQTTNTLWLLGDDSSNSGL